MKGILFCFFIIPILVFSCEARKSAPSNKVTDITKRHNLDSDSVIKTEANTLQAEYEEKKLKEFHLVLKKLQIGSLKELPNNITAYRLVVDFGWGNSWSGAPLALAIYDTPDSTALVETFEINPVSRRSETYLNAAWQHLRYRVSKENFLELEKTIAEKGFWTAYSFDLNPKGWRMLDHDKFYIELRKGSQYKLLVREWGHDLKLKDDYVVPFLLATKFNDTVGYSLKTEFKKKNPTK